MKTIIDEVRLVSGWRGMDGNIYTCVGDRFDTEFISSLMQTLSHALEGSYEVEIDSINELISIGDFERTVALVGFEEVDSHHFCNMFNVVVYNGLEERKGRFTRISKTIYSELKDNGIDIKKTLSFNSI